MYLLFGVGLLLHLTHHQFIIYSKDLKPLSVHNTILKYAE